MPHYNTILDIINDTLDNKDISSTEIAKDMNIPRHKIVDFRNEDIKDKSLLFEIFNLLFPAKSSQDLALIKEMASNCNLRELKNIYQNREMIKEDMPHIPSYLLSEFSNDILRQILVKTTRNQLRDSGNHLEEGLARAGAEGFIGGAAMVAGSMLAKKVTDKMAGKNKRKQIEALEDQKRELRSQMKRKEDDEFGRESLRKQIANLNARIEQIKAS
jgi:hypothetical protein